MVCAQPGLRALLKGHLFFNPNDVKQQPVGVKELDDSRFRGACFGQEGEVNLVFPVLDILAQQASAVRATNGKLLGVERQCAENAVPPTKFNSYGD